VYVITDHAPGTGSYLPRMDYHAIWGVGLEAPNLRGGLLSFAAEFDLETSVVNGIKQRGIDAEVGEGLKGAAAYASATLNVGGLTALGEFKYYDDFLVGAAPKNGEPYALLYSQPPTLERARARIDGTSRISGGHLRLDYNFGERGPVELRVHVNYGFFKSWFYADDHYVHDAWGGLELGWQEGHGHLNLSSGVRRETRLAASAPGGGGEEQVTYRRDIFVELDLEQRLAARHSIKLSSYLVFRQEPSIFTPDTFDDWLEGETTLSYKWAPRLSLGVFFERQGEPQIVRERARRDPLLGAENYLGGTAQWFFDSGTYLSLRAGQNREGLKCLNGLCRRQPSFSGVQLSFVGRF
jgi:hypothetical protein